MRSPKFRPNRSIGRRVTAFNTFSKMAAVHHRQLDFLILDHLRIMFDYPVKMWCPSGASLVNERCCKSALDRSRRFQERSRSFSNPFAQRALS